MVAHGMTCNCDDDGGIGGLLALEKTTGTNAGSYWYLYDGNGNVMQLLDASTLDVAAVYEYDAYGNTLVAEDWDFSGIVDDNPFRFSTKWFDTELGTGHELYYYGYRYYSPRLGRWLSRDPIGEKGGANLYAFLRNCPTSKIDPDGRVDPGYDPIDPGKPMWPGGPIPAQGPSTAPPSNRIHGCVDAFLTYVVGNGEPLEFGDGLMSSLLSQPSVEEEMAHVVRSMQAAATGYVGGCGKTRCRQDQGAIRVRPTGINPNVRLGVGGFDFVWAWACNSECDRPTYFRCADLCCCFCDAKCSVWWVVRDVYEFDKPPPGSVNIDSSERCDNNVGVRFFLGGMGPYWIADNYNLSGVRKQDYTFRWLECVQP
jgi:RHS repeat-associated protein